MSGVGDQYALSVVIPTRNRLGALPSLLTSLDRQTLPPAEFEVVVVDDGSVTAIDERTLAMKFPFALRVLRRTSDHGAQASRWTGVRAARGLRVLFLDDDTQSVPEALAAHAYPHNTDAVGLGPILYSAQATNTAYRRYMAKQYRQSFIRTFVQKKGLQDGEFYLCNGSATRELWDSVFLDAYRDHGDSFFIPQLDEYLTGLEFAHRSIAPAMLPTALLWHRDEKRFPQAWNDWRLGGAALGQIIVREPSVHRTSPLHRRLASDAAKERLRRMFLYAYWARPAPVVPILQWAPSAIESAPADWVPLWLCGLLLRMAHWEGVRSAIPSIRDARAALRLPRY